MKNTLPNTSNPITRDESINSQRAFGAAVIFTVIGFASVIFSGFLISQYPIWQAYGIGFITIANLIANVVTLLLIRRGKTALGLHILFWSLLVNLPLSVLLMKGVTLTLVGISLVTGFAQLFYLHPRSWRRLYQYVPVVIALIIVGIEALQPPFRMVSPYYGNIYGPGVLVFIIIGLMGLILYQSRETIAKSLRLKLMVWTGAIVSLLSIILAAYSIVNARQTAIQNAEEEARSVAELQAGNVENQLLPVLSAARTMAYSFGTDKNQNTSIPLTREQVNAMLKKVLEENPSFLGTWTLWEPNAFDGLDANYANSPLHDNTGRFIPYWVRVNGQIEGVPIVDYETPGLNDYYSIPRETKRETLLTPFFYEVEGVDLLMTSLVVPIVENDRFYGVAGVDLPIDFVQRIVDTVELYGGTATAVLMTEDGTLIAVRNQPDLTLQPATILYEDFDQIQFRIENERSFISLSPDGQYLRVFHPVIIGETLNRWEFGLIIPFSEIIAPATSVAIQEVLISLLLLALALVVLWFLTGQVVKPLGELTTAANAITQGDMNVVADVRSVDETGTLANAFNTMTDRLRSFIGSLEERVADRTRNLELAAEVGRTVSQVRSLDVMLTEAAELIRQQFDLYYVQVYLANPGQTHLALQAGTGDVGKTLLELKHQLPLNTNSLNGRAAVEKKSVVIENTLKSVTFKPNPLLPNTRSEMAVPLIINDIVVGVLDIQSEQEGALNRDLLPAFEALAGQIAIAIQNAKLLAETEQARAEVEAQARRLVRSNWLEYLDAIHKPERTGYVFEKNQVLPLDETKLPNVSENAIVAPITVTGEMVGSLTVELGGDSSSTASQSGLVEEVARQVALHVESLRLLESAERYRAEAEEASRRLTREGWQEYAQTNPNQAMGFYYDLNEVQPFSGNGKHQPDETALNLPLKVRDETIGRLAIHGLESDDSEALELANAVAERLGAHIESLRQFEETRRSQIELDKRAQELAAVAEISTISSQELDIQKMLETVVQLTQRKFGYYHAHVFTFDENTEHLKIVACGWKEGDEHEGTHGATEIPLMQEQSLVARAARARKSVIVNDVSNEPGWLPNPLLPDTASELAVPLVVGDQLLGVLDVQSDRLNAFTDEDANIQTTLASQVATALQNAQSFAKAQMQAQRESALNVISQKIQSATTVEAVLQIAARELGHALGAPMTIAQLSKKDSSS